MSTRLAEADRSLMDYLRKQGSATVEQMQTHLRVTATAVRQRLTRLTELGYIERKTQKQGRGRPSHRYLLTQEGLRSAGTNYSDLAVMLWQELRSVPDADLRRGILQRIAMRLGSLYGDAKAGSTAVERMQRFADLMQERDVPIEIRNEGGRPALAVLACPYPELAELDRGVCAMEKQLLSEVAGDAVRLTECRLDGANCCTFEMRGSSEQVESATASS